MSDIGRPETNPPFTAIIVWITHWYQTFPT